MSIIEEPASKNEKYQTLRGRAEARKQRAHGELLELLSLAAEQLGDLKRAREFEQSRLALLVKATDRQAAQTRLDRLQELERGTEGQRKLSLVVDQKLVASG